MTRVFKSYSPDALHNLRIAIEAEDRPTAALMDRIAQAINLAEVQEDFAKTGLLVQRVSGTDVGEFVERMRQRHQVDASRRTLQEKKKRELRTDAEDPLSDDYLAEHFDGWMFERTAFQNNGVGLTSLGDIATLVGLNNAALTQWVMTEQTNWMPNAPAIRSAGRGLQNDLRAHFKAA
jgi:hypothetical protein